MNLEKANRREDLVQGLMDTFGMPLYQARQMAASKTADVLLDMVAQNEDATYKTIVDERKALEEQVTNLRKEINSLYEERKTLRKAEEIKAEAEEMRAEAEEMRAEAETGKVKDMETAEARDRYRLFNLYKEYCEEIEMTPQNTTAYIYGLGSILAGQPLWPTSQIHAPQDAEKKKKETFQTVCLGKV